MAESLVGFLCLGMVGLVVILAWRSDAANKRKQKEQYESQKRIFEAWSVERYGPSEVREPERLRPPNPYEPGLDTEERNRRRMIVRQLPQKWAEEIIRQDRIMRERQSEHFESWGEKRFGSSWSETRDRLCRLVSANRTPSIEKLADSEIETLNSYLLAETLGAVNPSGGATAVKPEETAQPVRWAQQKCNNCGAPLLKGQCIYCNTTFSPD